MDMKRDITSMEYNKIKFETYINNDELFRIVREHTRELKSGEKGGVDFAQFETSLKELFYFKAMWHRKPSFEKLI
jgi:hypothetical protein